MKGLAITSKGIEKLVGQEINEILGSATETFPGCVVFDVDNIDDLVKFCYLTQGSERVLLLLCQCELSDLGKEIEKINIKKWTNKKRFRVSVRQLDSDIESEEITQIVGTQITKITKAKVDLENPDLVFFVFISQSKTFFGIDLANFDLQKRQYRVFPHQTSLRSTIAFALIRSIGYTKPLSILDPFCGSGTIPIEAALYSSNFPVNFHIKERFAFNKLGNLSKILDMVDKKIKKENLLIYGFDSFMGCVIGSRKNAKIAGIDKLINFSKLDITWLDTKFKKGEIDLIATQPPEPSYSHNQKDIRKLYDDFFYQAEFILKSDGKIGTITRKNDLLKLSAEKYNFKVTNEFIVYSGKQEMVISIFVKHPK